MEYAVWKKLYEHARAVQNARQLSPLMEVGGVGAAILTDQGNIYTGICIDTNSLRGLLLRIYGKGRSQDIEHLRK